MYSKNKTWWLMNELKFLRKSCFILLLFAANSMLAIDVDSYGALGNGYTDDTVAIQTALNALKSSGGTLNFTAGKTYVISQGLTFYNASTASNYTLTSTGNSFADYAVIKMKDGTGLGWGTWLLRIVNTANMTISKLVFDANRQTRVITAQTSAHNLYFADVQLLTLDRVESRNAVCDGAYFNGYPETDSSTFPENITIIDSVFKAAWRNNISFIRGQNIVIKRSQFLGASGHDPEAGIDFEPNNTGSTATYGIRDVTIEDCIFMDNNKNAISITTMRSSYNFLVKKNLFYGGAEYYALHIGSNHSEFKENLFHYFRHVRTGFGIVYFPYSVGFPVPASDNLFDNNYFWNIDLPDAADSCIYVNSNAGDANIITNNSAIDIGLTDLLNNNQSTTIYSNNFIKTGDYATHSLAFLTDNLSTEAENMSRNGSMSPEYRGGGTFGLYAVKPTSSTTWGEISGIFSGHTAVHKIRLRVIDHSAASEEVKMYINGSLRRTWVLSSNDNAWHWLLTEQQLTFGDTIAFRSIALDGAVTRFDRVEIFQTNWLSDITYNPKVEAEDMILNNYYIVENDNRIRATSNSAWGEASVYFYGKTDTHDSAHTIRIAALDEDDANDMIYLFINDVAVGIWTLNQSQPGDGNIWRTYYSVQKLSYGDKITLKTKGSDDSRIDYIEIE